MGKMKIIQLNSFTFYDLMIQLNHKDFRKAEESCRRSNLSRNLHLEPSELSVVSLQI